MTLLVLSVLASAAAVGVLVWILACALPPALQAQQRHFKGQIGLGLRTVALYIDPGQLWIGQMLLAVILGLTVLGLSGSVGLTLLIVGVMGLTPRLVIWRMRRVYLQHVREQLPDAMRMMAAGLKAGAGLWSVIDLHARELPHPLRVEFEMLVREQRLGQGVEPSLLALQARCPMEEMRLFVALLRMGHGSGGSLAQALNALALSCQRKLELEGKTDALTAQGRLQAIVMGLLPSALLLMLHVVDRDSARLLTHTFNGQVALACALLMQLLGFVLIRRIVRIEV